MGRSLAYTAFALVDHLRAQMNGHVFLSRDVCSTICVGSFVREFLVYIHIYLKAMKSRSGLMVTVLAGTSVSNSRALGSGLNIRLGSRIYTALEYQLDPHHTFVDH